jgi:hypothetical protein
MADMGKTAVLNYRFHEHRAAMFRKYRTTVYATGDVTELWSAADR